MRGAPPRPARLASTGWRRPNAAGWSCRCRGTVNGQHLAVFLPQEVVQRVTLLGRERKLPGHLAHMPAGQPGVEFEILVQLRLRRVSTDVAAIQRRKFMHFP